MPSSVGKPGGLSAMLIAISGCGGSGDFLRLFLFLKKRSIVSSGKRGNLGWTHNAKSLMWNSFQCQTDTNTTGAAGGIET